MPKQKQQTITGLDIGFYSFGSTNFAVLPHENSFGQSQYVPPITHTQDGGSACPNASTLAEVKSLTLTSLLSEPIIL